MNGRRRNLWIVAGVLAATVGCRSSAVNQTSGLPAAPAAAPAGGSSLSRMFQPKPPGPHVQKPVDAAIVNAARKTPLKPESVAHIAAELADGAVDSAFIGEDTTSADRDRILDEARQKYQAALKADPKNAQAMRVLARLYTRVGDRERAVNSYRELMQNHPQDHKAAYEFALALARFEDWNGATAACQHAIAGDPENRRYKRTLGVCLAQSGNFEGGFDAMLSVMPEAEARYTMAKLLADSEKPDAARQQLQLAAKADPNFAPAVEWLAAFDAPAMPNPIQTVGFEQPKPKTN